MSERRPLGSNPPEGRVIECSLLSMRYCNSLFFCVADMAVDAVFQATSRLVSNLPKLASFAERVLVFSEYAPGPGVPTSVSVDRKRSALGMLLEIFAPRPCDTTSGWYSVGPGSSLAARSGSFHRALCVSLQNVKAGGLRRVRLYLGEYCGPGLS